MKSSTKFSAFPHVNHEHMQTLMKCFSICSYCSKLCIEENMAETAILCSNCADICALMIKLHSSNSEFSKKFMKLCVEVCERCGEACGEMEVEHCQQCSKICHECAAACKHAMNE